MERSKGSGLVLLFNLFIYEPESRVSGEMVRFADDTRFSRMERSNVDCKELKTMSPDLMSGQQHGK